MTFMKTHHRDRRSTDDNKSYKFITYKYNSSARILANHLSFPSQSEPLSTFKCLLGKLFIPYTIFPKA